MAVDPRDTLLDNLKTWLEASSSPGAEREASVETALLYGIADGSSSSPSSTTVTPTTIASYRTNLSTADVLAAPTVGSISSGSGGSLAASLHGVAVIGVNRYGRTTRSAIQTITPSSSGSITIPITVGSFSFFDIYLSTASTDPAFVGRATAAQVTAGDTITAAATSTAGATFSGSGTSGNITVRVVGPGEASSAQVENTAYNLSGITEIDCATYEYLDVFGQLTTAGRTATRSLVLTPFFKNSSDSSWHAGEPYNHSFGGSNLNFNANQFNARFQVRGQVVAIAVAKLGNISDLDLYQIRS